MVHNKRSQETPIWRIFSSGYNLTRPSHTPAGTMGPPSPKHWLGAAAVDGQVAGDCSHRERRTFGNLLGGHVNPSEQGTLEVEANGQFDMGTDFSEPMVEDQFESPPFGYLSSTTFNPPPFPAAPT